MDKYPIRLKEKVNKLIGEMEKCAYLFSKNGEKDFTRKRKIPFSKVIKLLICMGGQSLNRELLDAWHLGLANAYRVGIYTATLKTFARCASFSV